VDQPTARTWLVSRRSHTDFVLRHVSRRAGDTRFRFSKSKQTTREVRVQVSGAEPRLAVAYVVTLLASERFADYVESITIDLAPLPRARSAEATAD